MKNLVAFVAASASAYSFTFAVDLLLGGLLGVYPSTAFLPGVTWSVVATVTAVLALRLAPTGRFLLIPFVALALLALLGGIVGHRYGLIVGFVMLAQAVGVWLATGRVQRSGSSRGMIWAAEAHTDQENLTWSWLRAVEWGRWPLFLSQAVAPPLVILFSWKSVALFFVALNVLWAVVIRYRFVSVPLAGYGALLARLKWISCPVSAACLFFTERKIEAGIALLWPVLIIFLGILPTTQVGRIQNMFMARLGYERREAT